MENNNSLKIFVVDDDAFCLNIYEQHLINLGYTDVLCFENGTGCLNSLTLQPDIIFLDHSMDILNGIEVLKKIKRFNPNIFVVIVSAQEDIQTAVNALKYGAFDYIIKGDNDDKKIEQVLNKILEVKEIIRKQKKGFVKKFLSLI